MFIEKIMEYKQAHIDQWPVVSNRASECGHPCVRYLVYNRTRSNEKSLPSAGLILVFNLGNDIEERVLKDLKEAGVFIKEQQRAFEWKEYQITGSIDAKIIDDGKVIPLEIKSCSPFVFDKINSVEDMKKSKYVYMRKYPTQLNLYLLMAEQERGLFIFKQKVNGAMKEIWMDLDYDLGEQTLKKIEQVNAHVLAGTLPEPIDDDICDDCNFQHICVPDRTRKEIVLADDPELEDKIDQWFTLKEVMKTYNELDKEIKEKVKGQENVLLGQFYITGKTVQRKGFTVKDSEYWQSKIIKA